MPSIRLTGRVICLVTAMAMGISGGPALSADAPSVRQVAVPSQPTEPAGRPAGRPKSRRVVILGTTITGEVLTPPVERTVPWQDPPAFRLEPAPLKHDFMRKLLTPVDRENILRETDPDH